MTELKPILIAGPTASGKSALALELAQRLGGVVINADSMQVYSELPILTARPSLADEARAPHKLYGHVPAREAYSAGRFVKEAADAIDAAKAAGLRPIIAGGTGLYFKALLEGLSPIPDVHESVRSHWRGMAAEHGAYALWQILTERDPVMAFRLDPNDTQRIVRALEILDATGQSLSYWQSQPGNPVVDPRDAHLFVLSPDRQELSARADQRFDAMIAAGALEEVDRLAQQGLEPTLPSMRALGVRPLSAHLRSECGLEDAVAAGKAETRQYVKRQLTWIRRYMISWEVLSKKEMETNAAEVVAFIRS